MTPLAIGIGIGPCDLLPPPMQITCEAVGGPVGEAAVDSVIPGAGVVFDILGDPAKALAALASDFFGAVNNLLATAAYDVTNETVWKLYGLTSGLGIMYAVISALLALNTAKGDADRRTWAIPGLLVYFISLGLGVFLIQTAADLSNMATRLFATVASDDYNAMFAALTTNLLEGPVAQLVPDSVGALTGILLALIYALIAIVLYVEMTILGALLMLLTVLYPIYGVGLVHPAPRSDIPSPARTRLYQYLDVVTAVLVAPVVIALVLALAAGTLAAGMVGTSLALLILSVIAPFALLTFLPVASIAASAGGLRGQINRPMASATRSARRAIARTP